MEIKLQAQARELKENLAADFVPAVLYGPGVANQNLKVRKIDLEKAVAAGGESTLVDLEITGGQTVKVLLKDLQFNPIKGTVRHVDLYQVDMKKKITTEIPLHFVGESKAVKELGCLLVKNMDSVEVECLPTDLVSFIEVDISALKEMHDTISVGDLNLPKGMEALDDAENSIVTVTEQEEEEVAPAPAAAEAAPAAAPAAAEKKEEKK